MSLYRLAAFLNRPLVRLLFRPRVTGTEHLPREGGYVLAANHLSGWDIWAVAYRLYPRAVRNMGKNQLFRRRFLGPLVRSLGAFPARDEEGLAGGLRAAIALAQAGGVVTSREVVVPGAGHTNSQNASKDDDDDDNESDEDGD